MSLMVLGPSPAKGDEEKRPLGLSRPMGGPPDPVAGVVLAKPEASLHPSAGRLEVRSWSRESEGDERTSWQCVADVLDRRSTPELDAAAQGVNLSAPSASFVLLGSTSARQSHRSAGWNESEQVNRALLIRDARSPIGAPGSEPSRTLEEGSYLAGNPGAMSSSAQSSGRHLERQIEEDNPEVAAVVQHLDAIRTTLMRHPSDATIRPKRALTGNQQYYPTTYQGSGSGYVAEPVAAAAPRPLPFETRFRLEMWPGGVVPYYVPREYEGTPLETGFREAATDWEQATEGLIRFQYVGRPPGEGEAWPEGCVHGLVLWDAADVPGARPRAGSSRNGVVREATQRGNGRVLSSSACHQDIILVWKKARKSGGTRQNGRHEIGHALGIAHMYDRMDRNYALRGRPSNRARDAFKKERSPTTIPLLDPYDLRSVSHLSYEQNFTDLFGEIMRRSYVVQPSVGDVARLRQYYFASEFPGSGFFHSLNPAWEQEDPAFPDPTNPYVGLRDRTPARGSPAVVVTAGATHVYVRGGGRLYHASDRDGWAWSVACADFASDPAAVRVPGRRILVAGFTGDGQLIHQSHDQRSHPIGGRWTAIRSQLPVPALPTERAPALVANGDGFEILYVGWIRGWPLVRVHSQNGVSADISVLDDVAPVNGSPSAIALDNETILLAVPAGYHDVDLVILGASGRVRLANTQPPAGLRAAGTGAALCSMGRGFGLFTTNSDNQVSFWHPVVAPNGNKMGGRVHVGTTPGACPILKRPPEVEGGDPSENANERPNEGDRLGARVAILGAPWDDLRRRPIVPGGIWVRDVAVVDA